MTYRRCILILVLGSGGCLMANSVQWARGPLPDDVPCVVPIDDGERRVEVTESTRRACVAMAHIVEPGAA